MKTKDEKEIERLKENMSDLKFTIFTGTVFICILFGVLAFGIHNNQGFIKSNSDMINQYADEVSLISGYEEVYDYETVEKYELWEPPTIEFCEDEYIHDEVCEYMSFTCSYLLEACLEEAGMEPEIRYYNESVCIKKTLVNYGD